MTKRKSYRTISIPSDLLDKIDKVIKDNDDGYSSRAEYIKQAIREKLKG